MDACKPDHGYTYESPAIINLFQVRPYLLRKYDYSFLIIYFLHEQFIIANMVRLKKQCTLYICCLKEINVDFLLDFVWVQPGGSESIPSVCYRVSQVNRTFFKYDFCFPPKTTMMVCNSRCFTFFSPIYLTGGPILLTY